MFRKIAEEFPSLEPRINRELARLLAYTQDETATERLLEEIPDATREEAAEYLSGNLCRCGSYVKILDAVMDLLACRAERLGNG